MNDGKSVTSLELDTQFGHDGFLIEVGELGKAVGRFLDSKIIPQKGTQAVPVFHNQSDFDLIGKLVKEGSHVLDLGCGSGDMLEYLIRKKNVRESSTASKMTYKLSSETWTKAALPTSRTEALIMPSSTARFRKSATRWHF